MVLTDTTNLITFGNEKIDNLETKPIHSIVYC